MVMRRKFTPEFKARVVLEMLIEQKSAAQASQELKSGSAEIKIPDSTREIHAAISGIRELDTWVCLELPEDELTEFLRNSQCATPLSIADKISSHLSIQSTMGPPKY